MNKPQNTRTITSISRFARKAVALAEAAECTANGTAFMYDLDESGNAAIVAGDYSGDVIVPEEIGEDGAAVTSIAAGAFRDSAALRSVAIPESVASIGAKAFSGCGRLEFVEMRNPSVVIAADAFEGCSGLLAVVMPRAAAADTGALFADSPSASVYRADRVDSGAEKAQIASAALASISGASGGSGVCSMTLDARLSGGVDANFDSSKVKIIRAASLEEMKKKTLADASTDPIQGKITARDMLGVTLRVKPDISSDTDIMVEDDDELPSPAKRYFRATKL